MIGSKIRGVSDESAANYLFETEPGRQMNVAVSVVVVIACNLRACLMMFSFACVAAIHLAEVQLPGQIPMAALCPAHQDCLVRVFRPLLKSRFWQVGRGS